MFLKFNCDAFYNGEVIYTKDQEVFVDNKLGMASRWIRRGLAVQIEEVKKEVAKFEGLNAALMNDKNKSSKNKHDKSNKSKKQKVETDQEPKQDEAVGPVKTDDIEL